MPAIECSVARALFRGRRSIYNRAAVSDDKNVLGEPLSSCCTSPMTGFHRDGCCRTGPHDHGVHSVCARMTEEFLEFSRAQGNDLSTPVPAFGFPGLRPGDGWCLCAARWKEALDAGVAPPVVLEATHEDTLEFVELDELREHAVPPMPGGGGRGPLN